MYVRSALFLAATLVVAAGCSGDPKPLGMATTPEAAKAALISALDSMKAGATPDDLAKKSIYYRDDILRAGVKLVDYAIEGEPKENGTGMTFSVTLTIQSGDKPATKRKLGLRVVTDPNTSIMKEDALP